MRHRTVVPAVLVALLASSPAIAATIPGEFVVEAKPLKAATATDTVTATLYADSTCTTQVATTGAITMQDVEMTEVLKPFKPKSATEKDPGTVRLHFTFNATPPGGDLFLSVTGSVAGSVVGYPSACQAQEPNNALEVICQEIAGTPDCDLASAIRDVAGVPLQIFVGTTSVAGGDLGNRAATTATCTAAAASQGLHCGGGAIALLAYSGGDDIANMPANHGVSTKARIVVAGSNVKVADNWADLIDGSWDACLGSYGGCYPDGPPNGGLSGDYYMTGAHDDGTLASGENCGDWSLESAALIGASPFFYNSGGTGTFAGGGACVDPNCCFETNNTMLCLCY